MSLARFTFYALWIAPVPLLALLATVMRKHRLDRQFPAFFVYCVFGALRTPILLLVFHRSAAYFYCYYAAEAVSAFLGLAAIYEVFLSLFRRYDSSGRLAQSLFRWVGAALVVAAVATAMASPGSDENRLMAASLVIARSVRLVQFGLLFFLFLAVSYAGLSWRSHVLGVAVGFGLFVAVEMAAVAMRAQTGLISQETFTFVKMGAYVCSALVWTAYFLAPQSVETTALVPVTVEMKGWNQALRQLLLR